MSDRGMMVNIISFQVFSLQDQLEFVRNVSEWTERQPAFYHGHFAFVDFTRYALSTTPFRSSPFLYLLR